MPLPVCSTPSGIMESVTLKEPIWLHPDGRCSTPSGIMESVTVVVMLAVIVF